jgi:hypothetical protein
MYKKLLLVFLSIIAINAAQAQTEKGNQSLGLNFGLSTNNLTPENLIPTPTITTPRLQGSKKTIVFLPVTVILLQINWMLA